MAKFSRYVSFLRSPYGLIFAFTLLILPFQNCSNVNFKTLESASLASAACAPSEGCVPEPVCLFNGEIVKGGQSITAYLASTVTASESCQPEKRTCQDGQLSGSYLYSSCTPDAPRSCLFDGRTIPHGQAVTAFLASTTPYGQACRSQQRVCNDGSLSGTYNYSSCVMDGPAACLFNGVTMKSGTSVVAYQESQVEPGKACVPETRVCDNGKLSGSFGFSSCAVRPERACLFNGVTIPSNGQVVAYTTSSVPYGQKCVPNNRVCKDGVLNGTGEFSTCTVNKPLSCIFNNRTLAHEEEVTAYLAANVPFGQTCQSESRKCNNGALSGSYQASSCTVTPPAGCTFNGKNLAHGGVVEAFFTANVPYGQTCRSETRACVNGTLTGSAPHPACAPEAPANCNFNGQTVAHGASVNAFAANSVAFGQTCASQTRTCNNGTLSGSYPAPSCVVGPASDCMFNGRTVAHNTSVNAFTTATVPFGGTCAQQTRTCYNGNLSGNAAFGACTVTPPANCQLNGQTIAHGAFVDMFAAPSVPYGASCASERRSCHNGQLSGTYASPACQPQPPAACTFGGTQVAHGQSVSAYSTATVPYGQTCTGETRTCANGALSGSFGHTSCQVEPPLELWTWQATFYQTTCPFLCDGQQVVTCTGTGCPGKSYWHYGAGWPGVPPYPVGSQQTTRPPFIGWYPYGIQIN